MWRCCRARAAIDRPRGPAWLLDWALLACLVVIAVQLIPLRPSVRERYRRTLAVDRVVALGAAPADDPPHRAVARVGSTRWALALARRLRRHVLVRAGMFAAAASRRPPRDCVAGDRADHARRRAASDRADAAVLDWRPISAGASPYGPFVNRNGFAGWLAMALPLSSAMPSRAIDRSRRFAATRAGRVIDSMQLWLAGSAILMTGGLLASLSRAGILGGGVGLRRFVMVATRVAGAGIGWMMSGWWRWWWPRSPM